MERHERHVRNEGGESNRAGGAVSPPVVDGDSSSTAEVSITAHSALFRINLPRLPLHPRHPYVPVNLSAFEVDHLLQ